MLARVFLLSVRSPSLVVRFLGVSSFPFVLLSPFGRRRSTSGSFNIERAWESYRRKRVRLHTIVSLMAHSKTMKKKSKMEGKKGDE